MKYRIKVAGLCETGIYDSGIKQINDYTMIYSGLPNDNKTKKAHGVAVCLDKETSRVWQQSGSEWEAINERIIKIRLNCTPINITVIVVYSPVNPTNRSTSDISDKFYFDLQETLDNVPTTDMLMLMGDFNARVGRTEHLISSQTVGPFTTDVCNENGQRLLDLCLTNNLVISNTFYQHKAVHQTSWMHPGNKQWHTLDYTLVNKKFRSSVEDVRFHRKAAGVIGTDHHLMRTKIKFHLKSRRKIQNQRLFRLDQSKMKNDEKLLSFQDDLAKKHRSKNDEGSDINEKYEHFVSVIKETATTHFKSDSKNTKKMKAWLTDEIVELAEKKGEAYLKWLNYRGTSSEKKYRDKYVSLRRLVKSKVDQRQVEYWDNLSEEIELAIKQHDPATAYAMIRRLRGGKQRIEHMPILDKHGKLLCSASERLDRFREFFSELLNVNSVIDPTLIDEIKPASISATEKVRQEKPPTLAEVQLALKQMKSGKAPGSDEITADLLKAGGATTVKWLHEMFVDIWKTEEIVEDWGLAILIRLFKNKGDKKLCDNYRGISLLSVTSKLFSRVILNRIQHVVDSQLLEEQAGFRANRSTIDQVFTLKIVMEKCREFNNPLHMCFIDIQKAYDSVNRELLWKICRHYGLTEKIVKLLKLIHKDTRAKVRINGELSDSFNTETGVLQGGIPSCILFNIFFDFVIRKVLEEAALTGITFGYGSNEFYYTKKEKYDEFDILALMYADDLVANCNSLDDLEKFIYAFEKVTQAYGLTLNVKKTVVMSLQQFETDSKGKITRDKEVQQPDTNIIIRNKKVETTDSFSYLGCIVSNDQRMDKEIESRLSKASTAFNMLRGVIWYRKTISVEAKLRIFRACVLPVLLYGSEVWSLTVVQENRVNTFYMKCLRTLLGLNLGDRVPTHTILQLSGQPTIGSIMGRNRLRWFGHANRMENEQNGPSLVKKIMFSYFPDTKRPGNVGTRKRWEDKIMNDLNLFNIKNWRRNVKDRDSWREMINRNVKTTTVSPNIKQVIRGYKERADKRRSDEVKASHAKPPRKVTEALKKGTNNNYTCPNCKKQFKPQGITGHVRSCAKDWCKKNNIILGK
jgi:hypothetical protein